MSLFPLQIKFLLHTYAACEPWPVESGAIADIKAYFLNNGVIEPDSRIPGSGFKTTLLGKTWVQLICNVPMPRQIFADAQGKEIVV